MPKLQTVYLVTDYINYEGESVIAGFTNRDEAFKYAETVPINADGRSIYTLVLNCPSAIPDMIDTRRK
jgi:hypothetical protein